MRPAWRGVRNYDVSQLQLFTADRGFVLGESLLGVEPLGAAGGDVPMPATFTSIRISSPTTVEAGLFVHREVETCELSATLPELVDLNGQWIVIKYGATELYRGRAALQQWTESVEVDAAYKPGNTAVKTYRVALTATNGEEALAGMSTPARTFTTATLAQRIASWTGLSVTTQSPAVDLPVGWQNNGFDTATVRRIYRGTDQLGSLLDTIRAEAKLRNMTFIYSPLAATPFVLKPNNQWLTGTGAAPLTFTDDAGHTSIAPPVTGDRFVHQGRYIGYTSRTVGFDLSMFTNGVTIRWGQYDVESPPVDGNPVETVFGPYRASGNSSSDVVVDLGTLDVASPGSNPYWLSRAITQVLPLRAAPAMFTKEVTTPLQSTQQLAGTVPGMAMLEHDGVSERVAVLGRSHNITPDKWLVTYTLGPPHLLDRSSDFDPGTPEVHTPVYGIPTKTVLEWVVPQYGTDETIYQAIYANPTSAPLVTSDQALLFTADVSLAAAPGTVKQLLVDNGGTDTFWVLFSSNPAIGSTNPSALWREGAPGFIGGRSHDREDQLVAGFKDFADGNVLFASEVDGYLMRQTAMRFGTTTTLVNQLTAGIRETGMLAWADNTGIQYMFDGTNWIPWFSPEKTFSPVFTAGGSNITVGNSIVNSWWRYSGGMVQWNFRFVIGSTANLGVGSYALTMPVSTRTELDHHNIGSMTYFDTSAGTTYHRTCATVGTVGSFAMVDSNGTLLGAAAPVAWANNDQFGMNIRYLPSTGVYL